MKPLAMPTISSPLSNPMQSNSPLDLRKNIFRWCLPGSIKISFAILTLCFASLKVSAATITWGSATTITADADVNTNGTALYAYTGGSANTVNGVAFTAGTGFAAWGSVSFTSGFTANSANAFAVAADPFQQLSVAYTNVLRGGAYGGTAAGTVTLNGLTVGRDYSVQIWVNDSRLAGNGRTETINGTTVTLDYNSADALGGVGQYAIGYFTADNTNQAFAMTPSASGSVQLNALSVRDNGLPIRTWLGSSGTSWGANGNWSPAIAPFPGNSIIFNASSTLNLATMLDANRTVSSLTLSNAPAAVSIGSDGNTLTINSGINLFGASQSLTISDAAVLGASQTWNVTNNGVVAVNGGLSGSGALTIAGGGTVSFGAPVTYTGNTTINLGKLVIGSAGTIASTNITVGSGAIFDVSAESPNYVLNGSKLTSSSSGAVINGTSDCSAGTISMTYDGVNPPFVQTNGTMTLSGSTVINVNIPGTVLGAGNYTIIAAATLGNAGLVTGALPSVNITGNGTVGAVTLAINGSGGLDMFVATPAVWTGATDNTWITGGNWLATTEPATGDAILFNNSSTANLSITQNDPSGGAQWGVSVLNPSGSVTIGGPNSLQIYGGGLNLSAASQNLTVSAPLVINADQNWLVTNSRTLTISGAVSTISGGNVTIAGGGKVLMGAPNILNGLTNASPAAGDFTVNSTLDLNGNSQVMNGLSGSSSGIVDNTGAGAVTLTVGGNGDSGTFNGVIQNTGGALALDVFGGGLTLNSSNNTYSGGTTFEAGSTLSFPSSTATYGTGPVTFKPGSTSYAGKITLTNALSLDSCYLRVGGANNNIQTWSGPVTVTNGFQMSGDGGTFSVTLSGPMNIGTGGISITNTGGNGPNEGFNVSLTGDLLSGVISGSGGITYYCNGGSSRLTVQGANTYTGGTIVNGTGNGKLNVYNSINPFSTGSVTLNAGAILESAPGSATITNALTLNGGTLESEAQFNNYNTLTWSGPITLTADSALVQFENSTLNNNQSVGVIVSGPLNMNGFTLTCSSPFDAFGGSTISGTISGAGNIFYNSFANNTLTISGSNTFSGTFRSGVTGGTGKLSIANVYALQNATLDMNAADAGNVSITVNAVIGALTGTRNLNLGSGNVSIGNNNASTTYDGVLGGAASLVKIGSGTLTLTGLSTNAGNTTVSGGTLSFSQPNFPILSTVTVTNGAFLNLNADTTNIVAGLVLNGISQPNAVYKSGNSGGRITGIGALLVINPNQVWTGASSTSWNTGGNWLSGTIPSGTNNVLFNNSSTANLSTVLNADFNILSLVVANPSGLVSIGGANTLTLTNGINMAAATQPLKITAPLVLGAAQTWTVTNTVSGLSISNLSGAATLTLAGGGTVTLNGTNSSTGNRIITGGTTLKFAGSGTNAFQTSGTIYVANTTTTGTIDLNGSTQTSPSFVAFPFTSTTTITNGTLVCNAANTAVPNSNPEYQYLGTINLASNGYYITSQRLLLGNNFNNFAMTINGTNVGGAITFGGDNANVMNYVGVAASQAGNLNINGGTVNFTNSSVGTGNGWLNVGANNASAKGSILVNGGSLNVGTWLKMSSVFNTFAGQTATSLLTITNNGSVTIGGGNAGTNGILFMGGGNGDATANTGTSTLTLVNGGTLTVAQIQSGNSGTKTINFNGGTLAARPGATNNFLSAATALTVNIQNGGATINSGANSIAIAAALVANGTGGLTKTGTGTLALSGANTYTGITTVSAGTLLANNVSGTGTGAGALNINSGATLGGTGVIGSSVTNNAGGILSPGVAGSGTLNLTNKLALLAGSTNTFVVNGTTSLASNTVALGATGAVTYGGVLNIVTNGTFTIGQTFTLFSGAGATTAGNFASIAGSPGAGKNFSFTNGVLSVVSSGPTLTSVTPNPLTGSGYGATLNLTGSGFTGATAVLLTNVTAAAGASYAPTVNSDTSISVNFVPGTTATTWNATVVNGAPSTQVGFTVIVPTKVNITGALNAAGAGKLVLSGTGGVAGNKYAVQSTTNLAPPVVWSSLVTNVFGGGGSFNYTNTMSPSTPSLFLRIVQ